MVLEECIDRGLVDPKTYRPSPAGEALAAAKLLKQTALAEADGVLDDFLKTVEALNQDEDGLGKVDEVWLFGSLLRHEPDVGDIDLGQPSHVEPSAGSVGRVVPSSPADLGPSFGYGRAC